MKQTLLLWVGFTVSLILYVVTVLYELDFFEKFVSLMSMLEIYELDEVVIPLIIFGMFLIIHLIQARNRVLVEEEKSKIYLAMLSSSYHILRNFLNQMQFFKMEAEKTPAFDKQVIRDLDKNVEEALALIEKLGDLEKINEQSIKNSVGTKI